MDRKHEVRTCTLNGNKTQRNYVKTQNQLHVYPTTAYLLICTIHSCLLQSIYSSASEYIVGPFESGSLSL